MAWAGMLDALSELTQSVCCVRIDVPFVCPRRKGGEGGRLPQPEPSTFYKHVDISGVAGTASTWDTIPLEALLSELRQITIQGSAVHVDADRAAFAADFASIVSDLDRGILLGNCHGRLVVGPKGTGKSSFLQALVLAVQKLAEHTIAIWVDAATADVGSPALAIMRGVAELLPVGLPIPHELVTAAENDDLPGVLDVVFVMGLRVLLVVDEYPTVYSRPACVGDKWTRQVYAMGQRATSPQSHVVVLSGSAPYTRSMCFGKLPLDLAKYPSYLGRARNLNSERFQVRTLGPIITAEGLRQFIQSWQPPDDMIAESDPRKLLRQQSALDGFFVTSGGNHRRMDDVLDALARGKAPSESWYKVADHATKYEPLRKAMVDHIVSSREAEGKRGILAEDPWSLLRWIPWTSLTVPGVADMALSERFAAADDGAIVFEQSMSSDSVRFVAPIQPLLLQERCVAFPHWPGWFDPYMRTCLRFPSGVLGIDAGTVFLHSISESGWDIRKAAGSDVSGPSAVVTETAAVEVGRGCSPCSSASAGAGTGPLASVAPRILRETDADVQQRAGAFNDYTLHLHYVRVSPQVLQSTGSSAKRGSGSVAAAEPPAKPLAAPAKRAVRPLPAPPAMPSAAAAKRGSQPPPATSVVAKLAKSATTAAAPAARHKPKPRGVSAAAAAATPAAVKHFAESAAVLDTASVLPAGLAGGGAASMRQIVATLEADGQPSQTLIAALASGVAYGIPLREKPDNKGGDVVIFHPHAAPPTTASAPQASVSAPQLAVSAPQTAVCRVLAAVVTVEMHRIQLKLGVRPFGRAAAQAAVAKLRSGAAALVAGFSADLVIQPVLYIATTRRCTSGARDACKPTLDGAKVILVEPHMLARCWASCVKQWATSAGLQQYLAPVSDVAGATTDAHASDDEDAADLAIDSDVDDADDSDGDASD